MSKKLRYFVALALVVLLLPFTRAFADDKPTVTVTTSFLQDMVTQIAGDAVNIELIIPAGADPHVYAPKANDATKVLEADLVLYHGLHFEGKMVEILEQKGVAVTKDFDKADLGEMEEDGVIEIDPHFWFDIPLYKKAVQTASMSLQEKFPEHKEDFEKRTADYLAQLDELDAWIKEELTKLNDDQRFLVTPHDAFNYFAKAYNFTVYAPQGISTDSEVSNQGIKETAEFIVEHKIPAIFAESTTNPERMTKLQEAAKSLGFDVKVVHGEDQELFSDSLAPEGESGDTFIDMYKHNINLIITNLTQ
ncbi:zinc ABC transporter substrate-binding protein [Aerococcaceae bacterium NML201209]|nr:zinc ABC transporter substrate-binding protein [Aerococcaceae bacterium NML201209]